MLRQVIWTITLWMLVISNVLTPVSYAMERVFDNEENITVANNKNIGWETIDNNSDNSGAEKSGGGGDK